MKRSLVITIMIFPASFALAQQNKTTQQINEQVWIPFIRAFGSGDDETFRAVHSKDVIRVMQDDKEIIGYDKYFKKVPDSVNQNGAIGKKALSSGLHSVLQAMTRLSKLAITNLRAPM